jgi:tRNA dimethylallyltransferase
MMDEGLEQEVRRLLDKGYHANLVAMKGLGYRQMVGYLQEEYDLQRAIYLIKRDTRHFAKRQMTLFKQISGIEWFDVSQYSAVSQLVEDIYIHVAGKICIE